MYIAFCLSLSASGQEFKAIASGIEKIDKLNQINKTLSQVNCPTCPDTQALSHEKSSLLSDINSTLLEQSVLSLEEANGLVAEFLESTTIPFDYALDGCFARAHKMAFLMEEKGIISSKAFVIGRLFAATKYGPASWRYHVAPVVLVKINAKFEPYIIDPALFDKAVPYDEWKNYITGAGIPGRSRNSGFRGSEYYTGRFVYDPTNAKATLSDYLPADLNDADATLARLMNIKKQLDAKK